MQFQHDDGGFSANLALPGYDSSITAVAGYFYSLCEQISYSEEFTNAKKKCIRKLRSCTRKNGAIDYSQGDTKGIGVYSTTYDIMPFTQGNALRIDMER